jgi:hypothetical protein
MKRFAKFCGALLGAVTGGVIIAICGAAGVDIDPGLAATIAGVCASVGTYLAPKNAEA